jgi:competence protein ComEC
MKPWKEPKSWFWQEAPFFRLLLPLIIAIFCYDRKLLPGLSDGQLIVVSVIVATILILLSLLKIAIGKLSILRFGLQQILIFLIGWTACLSYDISRDEQWFGKKLQTSQAFVCEVKNTPEEKARTWKLVVEVTASLAGNDAKPSKGEAFIYVYKDGNKLPIKAGDRIIVPSKWQEIKNPGNPYEFDYALFCRRNNIYHQQFLSGDQIKILPGTVNTSLIQDVHQWSMNALSSTIKDSSTLGLLQAMLLGDDINFKESDRQAYVDTGIIHIVAISGSHVAIFFVLSTFMFYWIRNKKYSWLKYILAIPIIWFYVMVAGAPASALRAAVMFTLLGIGFAIGRDSNSLNFLFATAFIMLLAEPAWLFSVGFQLSFIAVLSLILFYNRIQRLVYFQNPLLGFLWKSLAASLAAEILIAPVIIYYFHMLPASFLIANLLASVFMAVVLFLGLVLILVSKFATLASLVSLITTKLVLFFNAVIYYFQKLNPPALTHIHLTVIELLLIYLMVVFLGVYLIKRKMVSLQLSLATLSILLVLFIVDKVQIINNSDYIVYNVSHENYSEIIKGSQFFPLVSGDNNTRGREFATKEQHIISGAWKPGDLRFGNTPFTINNRNVLVLAEPAFVDSTASFPVDYLVLNYPLKEFNAVLLKKVFRFKKLIVGSDQKRYIAAQWKDSCKKYGIPHHITLFDGAFVLSREMRQ